MDTFMKNLMTHLVLQTIEKGASFQCFVKRKRPWKLHKILHYSFNGKKGGKKRKSPRLYNDSFSPSFQSSHDRSKSISLEASARTQSLSNTHITQITCISKHLTCSLVVLRSVTKKKNLRPKIVLPGGSSNSSLLYFFLEVGGENKLAKVCATQSIWLEEKC